MTQSYRSGKNTPCPICGRTKDSDCAIDPADNGGQKVRCHTHIDQDAEVAGFVYQGATDCGTWGLYFTQSDRDKKEVRSRSKAEYFYTELDQDGELQPVVRVTRSDDGSGKKNVFQSSYVKGEWVNGITMGTSCRIHLYRIFDRINQRAKAEGSPIVIVEGEGKADLLLSMGIAATTSIGGAGKWRRYGHQNYLRDLEGAEVVLCPDRDLPGIKHMREIAAETGATKWIYSYPDSPLWAKLPEKGGVDIADWVADYRLSAEQVLGAIEGERSAEKEQQNTNTTASDVDDQPTLPPALNPADEVTISTIDNHIYCRLFGAGRGTYITINDAFYHYDNRGYWVRQDDRRIYKLIGQQCRAAYKVRRDAKGLTREITYPYAKDGSMKSAFNFSRSLLDRTSDLPYNNHLMCFENGVVDVRTGELHPHDPKHFLTSAIAAPYIKDAECPEAFRSFVASAFGEELIEVVQAVTSMLLDPTAHYGRFVHLIGQSGSGKGTMLRLWLEMFGIENTRSINSFSEIETAEGRHHHLTGVRLCALPDVGGYMRGLKSFYELTDNGPMSGRALYSPSAYQTQWHTRFVIASVDHLQIENSGDGWDRRVIPLPTKPRSGAMNPRLFEELSAVKGEIVSWALSIPRERREWILANLSLYERIETAMADASISGDPVRYFVDLCLRPTPSGEASISIQNHMLHTWYEAFCLVHGYQRMSMSRFVSHLKTILPNQFQPRKRALVADNPDRPWVPAHWTGLKVLPTVFESAEDGSVRCIKSDCVEGGLAAFVHAKNTNGITVNSTGTFEKYRAVQGEDADPVLFESQSRQGFQELSTGSTGSTGSFQSVEKSCDDQDNFAQNSDELSYQASKTANKYRILPSDPVLPVLMGQESANPDISGVSGNAKNQDLPCTQQTDPVLPCTVRREHFEIGQQVGVQGSHHSGVVKNTRYVAGVVQYLVDGKGFSGWKSIDQIYPLPQAG